MQTTCLRLALIMCLAALSNSTQAAAEEQRASEERDPPPPVRMQYLRSRGTKPPEKIHYFKVMIANESDQPAWFLFPSRGDKPLPANGVFLNGNWRRRPFGAEEFSGKGGSAVEVTMYGGAFRAFRVPGKSTLKIAEYPIVSDEELDALTVGEARQLKVNGRTGLEKWLPYRTTSDENVAISGNHSIGDFKNLDWDDSKSTPRSDYPEEEVKDVRAEKYRRFTIPLPERTRVPD